MDLKISDHGPKLMINKECENDSDVLHKKEASWLSKGGMWVLEGALATHEVRGQSATTLK